MTPERIEEIKGKVSEIMSKGFEGGSQKTSADKWLEYKTKMLEVFEEDVPELLAALEEEQQEAHKQKEEAKRLNEICNQLAGEEMLFQDGKYETEMQKLEGKLAEAQQTIALKQSSIDILAGQVTDETALHAKTAAKLIIAEQTIARLQQDLIKSQTDADILLQMNRKLRKSIREGVKES